VRVGSLCSGFGGLDMAACAHFDGALAWYSEIEPAGVQVLSHHHPEARDIGDLTELDWEQLEKVDVVTAGFPCQPVSYAGQQQGTEDERWLFDDIAKGLGILRPRYILLENVPGLLTSNNGDAMASVLHGLSLLGGYEYRWGVVRASDAGAPHKRARWFCLATDTTNLGHERDGAARGRGDGSTNGDLGTAHTSGTERRVQEHEALGAAPGSAAELGECPGSVDTGVAAYADLEGLEGHGGLGGYPGELHPSPDDSEIVQNPDSGRGQGEVESPPSDISTSLTGVFQYGDYSQAVRRWELILGRRAPIPVFEGRLNQLFVEWMLGLPLGYVTGLGLSRTQELKLLGNGVVPHQGLLALNLLGQDPVVL